MIAAGCATTAGDEELTAKAAASLKASFKPAGQAGLDRLEQDDTQRACSAAAGKPLAKETASNLYLRAQMEAKAGKKAEAVKSATAALALVGDNKEFGEEIQKSINDWKK